MKVQDMAKMKNMMAAVVDADWNQVGFLGSSIKDVKVKETKDFVTTAWSEGLKLSNIVWRHTWTTTKEVVELLGI